MFLTAQRRAPRRSSRQSFANMYSTYLCCTQCTYVYAAGIGCACERPPRGSRLLCTTHTLCSRPRDVNVKRNICLIFTKQSVSFDARRRRARDATVTPTRRVHMSTFAQIHSHFADRTTRRTARLKTNNKQQRDRSLWLLAVARSSAY